jgi:hypothetical protein
MSGTSIPRGNALVNKQFSEALSAMAVRRPTPLTALTGPMPTEDKAMRKLKQQSTTEMPIVRVDELAKGRATPCRWIARTWSSCARSWATRTPKAWARR